MAANISIAVTQLQKHRFLTQRQRVMSIAAVATKRNISAADITAADRLRKFWDGYRERTGETQEQAGEKIGLSQAAFSQYLLASIPLNTNTILKFARLFGVDPREIKPEVGDLLGDVEVDTISPTTTTIAEAVEALPPEPKQEVLDFILYKIERSDKMVASEQFAKYSKMITQIRQDLENQRTKKKKRKK